MKAGCSDWLYISVCHYSWKCDVCDGSRLCENTLAVLIIEKTTSQIALYLTIITSVGVKRHLNSRALAFSHSLGRKRTYNWNKRILHP